MKRKVLAMMLSAAMVFSLAACGAKETTSEAVVEEVETEEAATEETATEETATEEVKEETSEATTEETSADSDLAYVQEKGTLVVGITEFDPMDYKNEAGEWIGFDADVAKKFAEKLGVSVEFVEIDWDSKIMELDAKSIDCVWNGMTLTDEVMSAMECSNPYCNNAQMVVISADKAAEYETVESMSELTFAVEAGSAGEAEVTALGYNVNSVQSQAAALMEVSAGTSDAAVIDALMAAAMVGEGTSYDNLTYTLGLNSEEYGVGFRKGSDLAAELNAFLKECYDDGSLMDIAKEYKVEASLIEQ